MVRASTSALVLERASKTAVPSVCVPRVSSSCLLSLQETLQDQQVGLTQAPFKLLLLPWILECELLCVPFKRGVSISPSPLGLLKLSPAGLQSQTFWGLIFPA